MNSDDQAADLALPVLPKKVDLVWNEPVNTGNAGALARKREARKQLQRLEG